MCVCVCVYVCVFVCVCVCVCDVHAHISFVQCSTLVHTCKGNVRTHTHTH